MGETHTWGKHTHGKWRDTRVGSSGRELRVKTKSEDKSEDKADFESPCQQLLSN